MRLVVGAVQVLAVPTGGEVVGGEDTAGARGGGEVGEQRAAVLAGQALVVKPDVRSGLGGRGADGHAEARREGRDLLLREVVAAEVELRVVNGETTLGALGASQKGLDGQNGNPVVRAVGRVLEVQVRGPVVGEILGHLARSAGGSGTDITRHRRVERVAADNVVDVGRRRHARLHDGVETLDGQGRAREAESGLDGRNERQG